MPSIQFTEMTTTYLNGLRLGIDNMNITEVASAASILFGLAQRGGVGYVFGNGGSASTASHFSNDMVKAALLSPSTCPRLFCLNDNMAITTAIANDRGYQFIFSDQLDLYLRPEDLVIAISTRGTSENIVTAVKSARKRNVETLAFIGFDGGKLINLVDHYVLVPLRDIRKVEDLHLAVGHIVTAILGGGSASCHQDTFEN